jgi:hypothetical protein
MDPALIKPAPPKSRGIAGVLFVCLAGVATAAVLLDVFVLPATGSSLFTAPGGRALLGAGAAAGAALIGFALRWALARPLEDKGDERARDHA